MPRKDEQIAKGQVIEAQPNNIYKIQTESGDVVKAYLSGKMRKFKIQVLIGDKVEYVVDQYGDNNRIVKRT